MKIRTVLLMSADDEEVKEEARKAAEKVKNIFRRPYFRTYYARNRAKIIARAVKWKEENRERFRTNNRRATAAYYRRQKRRQEAQAK